MTRERQIELAKLRASFLVERYLKLTDGRQIVTVELLRELITLAEERFAAYVMLENAIENNEPLLLTVTKLRFLPPHEPPILQPAIRLVVDNQHRSAP